jgi:hypothetical protein
MTKRDTNPRLSPQVVCLNDSCDEIIFGQHDTHFRPDIPGSFDFLDRSQDVIAHATRLHDLGIKGPDITLRIANAERCRFQPGSLSFFAF